MERDFVNQCCIQNQYYIMNQYQYQPIRLIKDMDQ